MPSAVSVPWNWSQNPSTYLGRVLSRGGVAAVVNRCCQSRYDRARSVAVQSNSDELFSIALSEKLLCENGKGSVSGSVGNEA